LDFSFFVIPPLDILGIQVLGADWVAALGFTPSLIDVILAVLAS
jgi:hypothetical protein